MAERETIYTPANGLSAARLLSALPCVYAVAVSNWRVAAAAFFFAVATDMADGPLARRRGEASRVGGLIDHSADALFLHCGSRRARMDRACTPALLPFLIAGSIRAVRCRQPRCRRTEAARGAASDATTASPISCSRGHPSCEISSAGRGRRMPYSTVSGGFSSR